MKKKRIYLDTSVIGGSFDDEFSEYSKRLVQAIINDSVTGVVSDITFNELEKAPEFVIDDFSRYAEKLEMIELSEEMTALAESYIQENVITRNYFEDALHIACATISHVDLLVSWNFKHIVNYNRIMQFNAINLLNGYRTLYIFSPMEVLVDGE